MCALSFPERKQKKNPKNCRELERELLYAVHPFFQAGKQQLVSSAEKRLAFFSLSARLIIRETKLAPPPPPLSSPPWKKPRLM